MMSDSELFWQRLDCAKQEMREAGLSSPLWDRLMWKLGVKVRPLFYRSALANGIETGVGCFLIMWSGAAFWGHAVYGIVLGAWAGLSLGATVPFYISGKVRRCGLSRWEDLPVTHYS